MSPAATVAHSLQFILLIFSFSNVLLLSESPGATPPSSLGLHRGQWRRPGGCRAGEDEAPLVRALSSESHHLSLTLRYGNNFKMKWQLILSEAILIELTRLASSSQGS